MTDAAKVMRDPRQVVSLSAAALPWDPELIAAETVGPFWEVLGELAITLLVTHEYEHLVVALANATAGPTCSVLRVPHPSGLVVDRGGHDGRDAVVHIACTRNPNQLMELRAADGWLRRSDRVADAAAPGLAPRATRFLPGCLYLHDLAIIAGRLHGNAVGMNAIVDLSSPEPALVWWPESVEDDGVPHLSSNTIQLNSIAAGRTLDQSFFTASTAAASDVRPGHPAWDVDRRGVIFSGRSRAPVVTGLTRPHSVRMAEDGGMWVADSGYGTLNRVEGDRAIPVASLGGWTRGLCLVDRFAIVGTSRVIPGFERYAPGIAAESSRCGIHVIDRATGSVVASLAWSAGNQIFAIDWMQSTLATEFLGGRPGADPTTIEAAWHCFAPAGSRLGPLWP